MSGGGIALYGDLFADMVSRRVALNPTYSQQRVREIVASGREPLEIISDLLPVDLIENDSGAIRDNKWEEWLSLCWGHDSDSLTALSVVRRISSREALAELLVRLPLVQIPKGCVKVEGRLRDAHVHAGALTVPTLTWAEHIRSGSFLRDAEVKEERGQNAVREYWQRMVVIRSYLGLARLLFAAMACCIKRRERADVRRRKGPITDYRAELLRLAVRILSREEGRAPLAKLLNAGLGLDALEYLDKSLSPSATDDVDVIGFVAMERRVLAHFLWSSYHRQCSDFETEVIWTYLRCKSHWFQVQSCLDGSAGLEHFRLYTLLGRTGVLKPSTDVAEAVNRWYRSRYANICLDVRLPIMPASRLRQVTPWLTKALDGISWRIVVAIGRYSLSEFEHVRHLPEASFEFVDVLSRDPIVAPRICGIDVVGLERDTPWREYVSLMTALRTRIETLLHRRCFIGYHCGEDTVHPFKGLCDIWFVLRRCQLRGGDRLGHALDLMAATPVEGAAGIRLPHLFWEEMKDSVADLLSVMSEVGDERAAAASQLWMSIDGGIDRDLSGVAFTDDALSELFIATRPFVAKMIKKIGIVIEACPTSNWRIKKRFLPTRHPIAWWIQDVGGRWVIGTDDPAVMPCTIESEMWSVRRALSKL